MVKKAQKKHRFDFMLEDVLSGAMGKCQTQNMDNEQMKLVAEGGWESSYSAVDL